MNFSNYSNVLLMPIALAHRKYIKGENKISCRYITVVPTSEICEYSKQAPCHENELIIDYSTMIFCQIIGSGHSYIKAFAILILFIMLYASLLMIIFYTRLTPNVIAIGNFFQLSEHNAGATIAVFCSGLSSIINYFLIYSLDTEMTINSMISSTLVMRNLFGGFMVLFYSITLFRPFFIRDAIFYISGWIVLIILIQKPFKNEFEGFILISLTIFYFVFAIVQDRWTRKKFIKLNQEKRKRWKAELGPRMLYNENTRESLKSDVAKHWADWNLIKTVEIEPDFQEEDPNKNRKTSWRNILDPNSESGKSHNTDLQKKILKYTMPIHIIIKIAIPMVNQRFPKHGWAKNFNCMSLVLSPIIAIPALNIPHQYWHLAIIPGVLCALLVFMTTKVDEVPSFHIVFAFYGTCLCILFNFVLTSEMKGVFNIFGLLFEMSRGAIGALFITFSNVIDGLILTLSLASWGSVRMAYVTLSANAMLSVFFAFGLTIILKSYDVGTEAIRTRAGAIGEIGLHFIVIEYFFVLFSLSVTSFQYRKSIGVFTICIYLIYLTFVLLSEFEYIHSYGTDHYLINVDKDVSDWA